MLNILPLLKSVNFMVKYSMQKLGTNKDFTDVEERVADKNKKNRNIRSI